MGDRGRKKGGPTKRWRIIIRTDLHRDLVYINVMTAYEYLT